MNLGEVLKRITSKKCIESIDKSELLEPIRADTLFLVKITDNLLELTCSQMLLFLDNSFWKWNKVPGPNPSYQKCAVCTQEYTLPKTSGQSEPITICPGTVGNIPLLRSEFESNATNYYSFL